MVKPHSHLTDFCTKTPTVSCFALYSLDFMLVFVCDACVAYLYYRVLKDRSCECFV